MTIDQAWRSRIIRHADAAPADLKAHPQNWRSHPPEQRAALIQTLDQVGWVQDVIVNETTGHVIDGHLRIELAIERGEASVPVVYVELSPEEELLVLATLDPLAAMAEPDTAALSALLDDILMPAGALGDLLAGLAKDAGIVQPVEGKTDPDEVPEQRETDVERGQVYRLGAHRLMCGDATAEADVTTLLAGQRPNLCVTDPPYGVDYDPEWRDELSYAPDRRRGKARNDDRADWRDAWALAPGDIIYAWSASLTCDEALAALEAAGFERRAQIIWAKPYAQGGHGNGYRWQHESCWYAVRKGAKTDWQGGAGEGTVWEVTPVGDPYGRNTDQRTDHANQKPVECMERPLRNHEGDVYDPFVGSGTTIIAAERTGRACYAMEISEQYVQVSIDRWEAYTGGTAVLLDTDHHQEAPAHEH